MGPLPCRPPRFERLMAGGLANNLREVIPPHFFTGREHCGKDGFQFHQDGFEAHREKILVGVILDFQHSGQIEQFGAHGVGATGSGEAPLLQQTLYLQMNFSDQTKLWFKVQGSRFKVGSLSAGPLAYFRETFPD